MVSVMLLSLPIVSQVLTRVAVAASARGDMAERGQHEGEGEAAGGAEELAAVEGGGGLHGESSIGFRARRRPA